MTSGRLQDDFRMTSGRLQGRLQEDFGKTQGALIEQPKSTLKALRENSKCNQRERDQLDFVISLEPKIFCLVLETRQSILSLDCMTK